MPDSYDFSGIATAYDVLCQDGRIIKNGAFNHQEGQVDAGGDEKALALVDSLHSGLWLSGDSPELG